MTRVLSELLGAAQPYFSMTIQQLEQAAGRPSTDIRLTTEIAHRARQKIAELQLDPNDTTPEELYHALLERFQHDEKLARESLKVATDASTQEILKTIVRFVKATSGKRTVFALKNSVAKRMLKKTPPKRAMKQLGYRSVDSILKHETVPQVYVAAFLCESPSWRKRFLDQYTKLQASDFELRPAEILLPQTDRWIQFTKFVTQHHRHTVVSFNELGTVIVLPVEAKRAGLLLTNLLFVVSGLNDISSATSFLKLQQFKPDFGKVVKDIVLQEPVTSAWLADKPVPWRVVHQYYARFKHAYNQLIFEPHVHPSDLEWYHPESFVEKIHPALEFWHDTRYTAYLQYDEKVSLNMLDVALNYCNRLPFAQRTIQSIRKSLWQELMIRYLNHENIEKAIASELAAQPAYVEIEDFN